MSSTRAAPTSTRCSHAPSALSGEKTDGPIFGEPSGIAVDPESGELFVTTGNSEEVERGRLRALSNRWRRPRQFQPTKIRRVARRPGRRARKRARRLDTGQRCAPRRLRLGDRRRGAVRVSFDGKLAPKRLPRHGSAPVGIAIDAEISATGGGSPPQLRRISIAINRNGHFASTGLPACQVDQIQPSTTSGALAACAPSLVGEGHFSADVKLPEQSPFPSERQGPRLQWQGQRQAGDPRSYLRYPAGADLRRAALLAQRGSRHLRHDA